MKSKQKILPFTVIVLAVNGDDTSLKWEVWIKYALLSDSLRPYLGNYERNCGGKITINQGTYAISHKNRKTPRIMNASEHFMVRGVLVVSSWIIGNFLAAQRFKKIIAINQQNQQDNQAVNELHLFIRKFGAEPAACVPAKECSWDDSP